MKKCSSNCFDDPDCNNNSAFVVLVKSGLEAYIECSVTVRDYSGLS